MASPTSVTSLSAYYRIKWRLEQEKPDCTTDEEWFDWIESDALYTRGRKVPFCHDCTPEFKAEAMSLGLCSFPDTVFVTVVDEDGEESLVGVDSVQARPEEQVDATPGETSSDVCIDGGWELREVRGVLPEASPADIHEILLAALDAKASSENHSSQDTNYESGSRGSNAR